MQPFGEETARRADLCSAWESVGRPHWGLEIPEQKYSSSLALVQTALGVTCESPGPSAGLSQSSTPLSTPPTPPGIQLGYPSLCQAALSPVPLP